MASSEGSRMRSFLPKGIVILGIMLAFFIMGSISLARAEGLDVKNNSSRKIHVHPHPSDESVFWSSCPNHDQAFVAKSSGRIDLYLCYIGELTVEARNEDFPGRDIKCTLKVNGSDRPPDGEEHPKDLRFSAFVKYRWHNVNSRKLSAFQELECVDR